MGTAVMATNTVNGVSIESIDDLLDDLDLGMTPSKGEEVETIVATSEPEHQEEAIVEDDISIDDLEMSIERAASYAEQDPGEEVAGNATEAVATQKAAAPKGGKTPKAAKAPKEATARKPRDIGSIDAAFFVLEGDASEMTPEALEQNKVDVIAAAPTQVKIAEKYENLFASLSVGKQPSVYVVQAFKFLDEKKTLSSTDIVAMLKGTYKQGTAQSQAGQIMKLFEATKIATRSKNTLELNDNSVVATKLREILNNANKAAA